MFHVSNQSTGNLEERLQLDLTLADYGLSEVAVVSKIDGGADILALQREQDRRRRRVKAGHLPPTQPGCIKKKVNIVVLLLN